MYSTTVALYPEQVTWVTLGVNLFILLYEYHGLKIWRLNIYILKYYMLMLIHVLCNLY